MSTKPLDIFSTPMVPMLDAAWCRENLFDGDSRTVGALLRKLQDKEAEMEQLRIAREALQEELLEALKVVRARREEDDAEEG